MESDKVKSIAELLDALDSPELDTSSSDTAPLDTAEMSKVDKALSDIKDMSDEDRMASVFDWKMRGFSARDIAKGLRVDVSTIYRWLRKNKQSARERLETELGADVVVDSVMFYERVEEYCLLEANTLKDEGAEVEKDGTIKRAQNNDSKRLRLQFLGAAVKVRKQRDELLQSCGVLPREPERIYHTMDEEKRNDDDVSKDERRRTREEMQERLMQLLEKGRSIGGA